jgi:hypothetical protein
MPCSLIRGAGILSAVERRMIQFLAPSSGSLFQPTLSTQSWCSRYLMNSMACRFHVTLWKINVDFISHE